MQVGDKIFIQGTEYTIWLIEDGIYHIIDDNGNGYCGNEEWLLKVHD